MFVFVLMLLLAFVLVLDGVVVFIGVDVFAGVETFIGVALFVALRALFVALFAPSGPHAAPKAATARSAERAKVFFIKLYSPVFSKYILRLQLLEAVS
jgi:hypothetical protein